MGWAADGLRATLLAAALAGAAGEAAAQVAVMEAYQEGSGLTTLSVQSLAQGADGMLWIGTQNGLFRFDGFRISREAMPGDAGIEVSDLQADRLGRLWVATDAGVYLRRGDRGVGRWSPVLRPDGAALRIDGKQRLAVDERGAVFAMDRASHVWTIPLPAAAAARIVATPLQLPAYDAFEGRFDAEAGPLRAVGAALWFACGRGLCRWQDGRLRTWGPGQGLPADSWGSLVAARDGGLWARGTAHLARLAPGGERFETTRAPASKLWPATVPTVEDRAGRILTATDDGIARWDGHAWRRWTPREGVPETAVRALLFDADGELWTGSAGRGLYRWVGYGRTEHWTPASGLPSPVVWSFARDGAGQLLASTSNGVARLDEATQRFERVEPPLPPAPGGSLATDDRGDTWWVVDGRVMSLPAGARRAREAWRDRGLDIALQATRSVVLSGVRAADRIDAAATPAGRQPLPAGMPEPYSLNAVVSDGTREWFLVGRGAYRLDGGRWEPLRDAAGRPVEVPERAAFAGPSEFWTADRHGIAVYDLAGGVARLQRRIDAATLGTANVQFLQADRQGRMWIGTDRGVFVHAGARWMRLDRSNGLLWNDVDGSAVYVDRDDAVWIGTSMGATRVSPAELAMTAPTLRVEELRFGDRPVAMAPSMHVRWAERRVRITFQTPQIGRGRATRLEYRLREDAGWEGFPGNVLQLESLDAGAYRVQVRAAARTALEQPGVPVEVAFAVDAPRWRSTPAYLAYALALVAAWFLSIQVLRARGRATRRRLERAIAERTAELEGSRALVRSLGTHNARALEQERKRVARELHDEMGQQLAALRMEISVLRLQALGGRAPDEGTLDMLLTRVDDLVASMRDVVSQLRPPALDGGLAVALDWLAAELEHHSAVPCDVEVDDCARRLTPDAAAMVFRIAQESLNNVRRHAAANRVSLRLQRDGAHCVLAIRDDGVGFDVASPRTGYGILGMEERALALGGTLSIESAPGQGTTVRLRLPLPEEAPEHAASSA
jgi:signal transduction histidine kinase/ligand-binding sensor domain-containing protein